MYYMFLSALFGVMFVMISCQEDPETKIDRLLAEYSGDRPGAAVTVIRDGIPVFRKGYGMARLEEMKTVAPETNFRLASVTKQFTAMAIMILEEQGKLAYEQTLTEIFPDFPEYGSSITVRNLLQHTSGLLDYESLIPDTATVQVRDADVLDMMKKVDSTYFEPGKQYRYSNSGYAVLAMIIEKTSGLTFARFLKEYIFDPLGMRRSVAFEKGISEVQNRAFGYTVENDTITFSDQSITSAVLGDGGIYSSVNDLFKWDQALYTDTLVSAASLEKAFTPLTLPDGTKEIYGFGWRIDRYKGHRRIHHIGSTSGFRSALLRFPDDKLTVIILANRSEPNLFPIAEKIADLYL